MDKIFKFLSQLFYETPEGKTGGPPLGERGDVEILSEGEEETPENEETENEEVPKEIPDEEPEENPEEEESEQEEVPEEEQESDKEHTRPDLKAITAKYPNIFKEFPQLRESYFRANAYAEVFPTVEDAKESAEKAQTLDGFEEALIKNGSAIELFDSIANTSPKAIERFVDNLLPNLYKFNTDLFVRATAPVTKNILWNAFQQGSRNPDGRTKDGKPFSNLAAAAQHIHNFLFGDANIEDPSKSRRDTKDDPERAQFEQERQNFEKERFKDLDSETQRVVGRQLGDLISNGLDPKNVMTPFLRNSIIEKVIDELGDKLKQDSRHMTKMESLWRRAKASGYPRGLATQIAKAYLDSAKLLVPEIRNKIKSEALKGKVASNNGNKRTAVPQSGGSGRKVSTDKVGAKQIDWSKTSDVDFLNDKVVLKKQ
jgi:hypothetical protein